MRMQRIPSPMRTEKQTKPPPFRACQIFNIWGDLLGRRSARRPRRRNPDRKRVRANLCRFERRALQPPDRARPFRMRPLRDCRGATAVARTSPRMNRRLFRISQRIAVTTMQRRSPATQMTGRTRGLQRRRKNRSGSRQQQETSRNQALHIFPKPWSLSPNP